MNLEDLSVRALHRLECSNSRLRHSIVEECFYNLRVLAQELPGREADEEFKGKLKETLQSVERATGLIEKHFEYKVAPGITVAALFPERYRSIQGAVSEIEKLAESGIPDPEAPEACEIFSDQMVQYVDRVLGQIDDLKGMIAELKIPVYDLLQELASIHRPECQKRGISLRVENGGESRLKVLAERENLLNALGELIRNAIRHAFKAEQDEEKRITLQATANRRTRDPVISIRDNGRGMTKKRLRLVGGAGASTSGGGDGIDMVRDIVEGQHFGVVSFESAEGEGTCVTVRLPRRAEPALRPEKDGKGELTEAQGDSRGAGKYAAAVVTLLLLAGVTGGLLWQGLPWQSGNTPKTVDPGKNPVPRTPEMPVTVAPDGYADYMDLAEAIKASEPGRTIHVTAGEYPGPLVLDKDVTIVGQGETRPKVRVETGPAILSAGGDAEVRNLDLSLEAEIRSAAVYVEGGNLVLRDCRISSRGLSAVEVAAGSAALEDSVVEDCRKSGIFVYGGTGTAVNGTQIRNCGGAGIAVSERGNVFCRQSEIRGCEKGGVRIYQRGGGTFENVDIAGCPVGGVVVRSGGEPAVRMCKIHDNPDDGVLIMKDGKGTFERNQIYNNAGNGVLILSAGSPRFVNNRIRDNGGRDLWVKEGAEAVLRDND